MSTFLREEIGVAMSGVKWDIGPFKLWQSTNDNIILFTPKQPQLALSSNGRYQCGISQFRQQVGGTYKITGGSAIFTITSAVQLNAKAFEELKEHWLREMNAIGPAPRTRNPKFVPLNVQKGTARVLINPVSGEQNEAHNDVNIGTPGGTNSFLVHLTELGAQEWVQGIKENKAIPGGVKMDYEYLRMMPDVGARVKLHGRRVFQHISAELNVSARGFFFGGSANIEAAWEKMVRSGAIEIEFIGTSLPPELEEIRQDLVTTFADQARTQWFNTLFAPKPEIDPAEAGNTRGVFGGANFAFKFRREEEVTDLEQTVRFVGWTWLKSSMDADLTALLHDLDESYVNEVNTEMSFPASVVVDADPQLEDVAISWSASEGKAPEAPVFGSEGGNASYVVTSHTPDDVMIRYNAKVNFLPPSWPVVTASGVARVGDGGNQTVIKASSWIGRHMIFMFVQEQGVIQMFDAAEDYLIVNVSYKGPHLPRTIRASARLSIFDPIEFSYPLSPTGEHGEARFSAFGVVGGRLVRSRDQLIDFSEEAVFCLINKDKNELQLVSNESVFSESAEDSIAARLMQSRGKMIVEHGRNGRTNGYAAEVPYTGSNGSEITGTVVGVEYTERGPVLLVQPGNGPVRHVNLRSLELADRFDDERKRVRVRVDEDSYAHSITVDL